MKVKCIQFINSTTGIQKKYIFFLMTPFVLDKRIKNFHFEILFSFNIEASENIFQFILNWFFIFIIYALLSVALVSSLVNFERLIVEEEPMGCWFGKSSLENLMVKVLPTRLKSACHVSFKWALPRLYPLPPVIRGEYIILLKMIWLIGSQFVSPNLT